MYTYIHVFNMFFFIFVYVYMYVCMYLYIYWFIYLLVILSFNHSIDGQCAKTICGTKPMSPTQQKHMWRCKFNIDGICANEYEH